MSFSRSARNRKDKCWKDSNKKRRENRRNRGVYRNKDKGRRKRHNKGEEKKKNRLKENKNKLKGWLRNNRQDDNAKRMREKDKEKFECASEKERSKDSSTSLWTINARLSIEGIPEGSAQTWALRLISRITKQNNLDTAISIWTALFFVSKKTTLLLQYRQWICKKKTKLKVLISLKKDTQATRMGHLVCFTSKKLKNDQKYCSVSFNGRECLGIAIDKYSI